MIDPGITSALLDGIVHEASISIVNVLMYETDATTVPLAMQARITQLASEGGKRRTWPAIEQPLDHHLYGPWPIQCCFTCLPPRLSICTATYHATLPLSHDGVQPA